MASTLYKNTIGLDISDGAIRLTKLKQRGKKILLESYGEVTLPEGLIVDGIIKQEEKVAALIQKLLKEVKGKKINTKNTITVLPESKTFIKVIQISYEEDEQIEESINTEIQNYIPLDLEDIYIDWQIIKKGNNTATILIGAAPKKIVAAYVSLLEKGGLNPYVLEIEAAPIIRSLITDEQKGAKIIIDFGAVRTGLIVYNQGAVQFTISLPISGNKITKTIAETLNLDLKKAEKAKIICGLDKTKCEGALLKILMSAITQLVNQIKKAIAFYSTNFPKAEPISEIILCGGGANFSEIDKVLSEKLQLPVKIGDPLTYLHKKNKVTIPKNKILSYTTAIGLALRAFQKEK